MSDNRTSAEVVQDFIRQGKLDDSLEDLRETLWERRMALKNLADAKARLALRVGDRVEVVAPDIRPRRLNGSKGVIEKMTKQKCHVRLDNNEGFYSFSPSLLLPEKV